MVVCREGTNCGLTGNSYALRAISAWAISVKVHQMEDSSRLLQSTVDAEQYLTGDQVVATLWYSKALIGLIETHASINKGMN